MMIPMSDHRAGAANTLRQVLTVKTVTVSRLTYCTDLLFRAGSAKVRWAVLKAAAEAGITHFDTAPSYGFGVAENDLAALLRAHPGFTVASKIGLHSPGGDDQGSRSVLLRKVAGKVFRSLSASQRDFRITNAQQSLEGSLRRLGRDHIELYLLHEPELHELDQEVWLEWLLRQQQAGLIGQFGISLSPDRLMAFLAAGSPLAAVVQTEDSLSGQEADVLLQHGRMLEFTQGYVAAERSAGRQTPEPEIIRLALSRNRSGSVLVNSIQPSVLRTLGSLP